MFDLKAYIESGVLEAYVSGLLSEAEARDVEAHRAAYPEVDAEIKEIEAVLLQYAKMGAPHLEANAKEDIWAKLNSKTEDEPKANGKVVTMHTPAGNSNIYRWLAAASVAGLLLSLGGNYYLYDQWKYTQHELATIKTEKSVLADQFGATKASYTTAAFELNVIKNPHNKVVKMMGLEIAPKAWAVVYWDSAGGKTFIDPADLPTPPTGKQYQLWAIAGGKPVDAGVFVVDTTKPSIQPVKDIKESQMFAVTLEPTGGSQAPTMTAMYVAGKTL